MTRTPMTQRPFAHRPWWIWLVAIGIVLYLGSAMAVGR